MGITQIMGYVEAIGGEHLETCDLCNNQRVRVEGQTVRLNNETIMWVCRSCSRGKRD